ncbi:MAG: hypothetical protein RJB34_1556 [Pseudomonadota bacterium]|jgi:hypothetical protein
MPIEKRSDLLANKALLSTLQLRSFAELLGDAGVQDAVALLRFKEPSAAELARMLDGFDPSDPLRPNSPVLSLPLKHLRRLGKVLREQLPAALGVNTVGEVAQMARWIERLSRMDEPADPFDEAPSAPRELIPKALGSISASSSYTQFVRERPLALSDMKLQFYVDIDLIDTVDNRLLAAFQFDRSPTLHLGYMANFRQDWVNEGTYLGEPLQSIGLAPGETRRIAVVDWQRKDSSRRSEDTEVNEQLDNMVTHTRALHEVVKATAREVQAGGTDMAASTLSAAAGIVGSIGASAALGTAIGAAAGAPVGGIGALPGALIGLGVGAVAGAIGVAVTGAANAQLGKVESDSSGRRKLSSSFSQRVNDTSSQQATSLRSVMSTVVVSGQQAERENLSTRAIANNNHAHALTIQYFEVLQHYRSRVSLNDHQALLYLPIKPLVFDAELVMDHWETLRQGFSGARRASFDAMIRVARRLTTSPLLAPDFKASDVEVLELKLQGIPMRVSPRLESERSDLDNLAPSRVNQPAKTRIWTLGGRNAKAGLLNSLFFDKIDRQYLEAHGTTHEFQVQVTLNLIPNKTIKWPLQLARDEQRLRLGVVEAVQNAVDDETAAEDRADDLVELVRAINARPYQFTRLLVLALEPEQLREVVESLVLAEPRQGSAPAPGTGRPTANMALLQGSAGLSRASLSQHNAKGMVLLGLQESIRAKINPVPRSEGVPLSKLVDPLPFGLTDGMLVFKLRTLSSKGHTADDFKQVEKLSALTTWRDYPSELAQELPKQLEEGSDRSIFLPTGGHFAEAILGRSNAAERLDGTRHIHWHELPNPLVASEIAALNAGSRAQTLPNTNPTQTSPVLTPSEPTTLPEPSLGAAAMAVLGQANLFRDMSKTTELVGMMGKLSDLANSMGNQAGQLAGSAQATALQQSGALAQQVAGLTSQLLQQQMAGGLPADATATQRAVAGNRLEDLIKKPLTSADGPANTGSASAAPASLQGVEKSIAQAFGIPATSSDGGLGSADSRLRTEQSGFLVPLDAPAEKGSASSIRDALPQALRSPTDAGVALNQVLRNNTQDPTLAASVRINELFISDLQPLLDAASNSKAQLDQALRLTLDLQAAHEQAGLDGKSPLNRAATALARAWRALLARSVSALAGGQLSALTELEDLILIAQTGLADALGLSQAEADMNTHIEAAGLRLTIQVLHQASEIKAAQAIQISGVVRLQIGSGAATTVQGVRVKAFSLQSLERSAELLTDASGGFVLNLTHDPLHLGGDSEGPLTPDLDLSVSLLALHPSSDALQADKRITIPGELTSKLIRAVFDDDGSNALVGSVVVTQPNRPIALTFQTLSAGVPVRRAAVQASISNGSAQIIQASTRTGDNDSRGLSSAKVLTGPAGSGLSFVAMVTQLTDGRTVTARADLQGP